MAATRQDADDSASLSPEAQAASLWTFVQLKARRFTSADALTVVRGLGDISRLDAKALARQLQEALPEHGVSMKYTNALQAAARMLGSSSFHAPEVLKPAQALLQLVSAASWLNRPVRDWKEGIQHFCDFAEGDQEGGGLHVYQIGFTPTSVTMDTPLTTAHDEQGRAVPQLQLQWLAEGESQLPAAIAGIETMRRRYEETGRGVVDGLAAAYYCLHTPHEDAQPLDPVNSELLVVEATVGHGFGDEVARGDEVKCWSELEKLHPKDKSPTYLLDEADWLVEGRRYRWQLSTVRMNGGSPRVLSRPLTQAESAKLLRRHQSALRSRRYFVHEDRVKDLASVSNAAQQVEIDGEQVRRHLPGGSDMLDSKLENSRVSVDMLLNLAKAMKVTDPSVLVRKPKREELALLKNDELLRTFISRVHDVVYEVPRRLSDDTVQLVDEAVNQLLAVLKNDVVMADGTVHSAFPRRDPYMAYANQGKDFLKRLKALGLVAYAGIHTTVRPFRARNFLESNIENPAPFKVETVLFLDIDLEEQA